MMANAARDPYWLAAVRAEVLDNPRIEETIEDKCSTCHLPMARFTAVQNDGTGMILDGGFIDPDSELHALAIDGVSCTLCHQVQADNFGGSSSYSGNFMIDAEIPPGQRPAFGPYPVDQPQASIMQGVSGFIPVESRHIEQSELCATCHTVYTPYVDSSGQTRGEFPEQMTYLEWFNSAYQLTDTCQDCHMPQAEGGVRLSATGGEPRSPFAKPSFVGGNSYMLSILEAFGEDMGVTASTEHLEDTIERVTNQLQHTTATIALEEVSISESSLVTTVVVESRVGHKFPSGFPARRAWLHFVVLDDNGQTVFESGAFKPDGTVIGNENDASPTGYEPHYQEITSSDQVQIYESIIANAEGSPTTNLLRGTRYLKDNRLLPLGFAKADVQADIGVWGSATMDDDFAGGSDRIRYVVDLGSAQGPFTINVELLYQSLGHRWANNLGRHQSPEIDRFLSYYNAVPNLPVAVDNETQVVGQ
jgi:hypothetical protein